MAFEETVFRFLYNLSGNSVFIDTFFVWLARFYPYVLIAVGIIGIARGGERTRRMLFFAFLAAGIAVLLNLPLRKLFYRPRPFVEHELIPLISYSAERSSFPSNHAAASFAFGCFLYFRHRGLGFLFLFAALLVSISRIYVGVHYPLDILVALVFGYAAALVTKRIEKRFLQLTETA